MNYEEKLKEVQDGNASALDLFALLKQDKKRIEQLLTKVEQEAWSELDTRSEKTFVQNGFSFEVRNGGRTFSYKNIPSWIQKNSEIKSIEEQSKQAFISKEKGMMTATSEGEEIILPDVSYRKDSILVKKVS